MNAEEIIKEVSTMSSYILEDDIRLYHKYTSALCDNALVLDVGTGLGKSAVALALSNPKVKIITIDNGEYPAQRNWASSMQEYEEMIYQTLKDHNIDNVDFLLLDILDPKFRISGIDMFHLDGESGAEEKILQKVFPSVDIGGILLIRNWDRFSEKALHIMGDGIELVEARGKIQVVRKV